MDVDHNVDHNKAIIRRYLTEGPTNEEIALASLTPDAVYYDPGSPPSVGHEGQRRRTAALLTAFPDPKFTPDGGWIGVSAHTQDGEVTVAVKDTGIGIAPQDQVKVFEEFQQVGKANDRSREGTGLGLTLAKRFVELHGGRIWLESEVGKGTTFTFAVPVGRTVAAPA